jgi:C-terminal processing protease CtpA/Prc
MFKISKAGLTIVLLAIAITSFSVGRVVAQGGDLQSKLETYLQVLELVKSDYVDKDIDDQKLVYGSIRGLLDALDDPYTRLV